jgi:hypothetical protein
MFKTKIFESQIIYKSLGARKPKGLNRIAKINYVTYVWEKRNLVLIIIIWGARVAQWVRSLDLTAHTSLSPIRRGFAPGFVNYKKGCTWLPAASDKVYQLLAHGQWFSPGTPASSTTKNSHHDIAEILLKVALKHQKSNQNQ